jgi:cobyrinic acid a,c-diamide synthase
MEEGSAASGAAMPRLVIAGLSGESGKTLVSLALLLEAQRRGVPVRAFKKGPDYIDAAWLRWASGKPARNLDTHLMGFERALRSFAAHGVSAGLNVVEGNRGLYDGLDAQGTHSTAELAKAIRAPVVIVVNATKVTRTAAAVVLGCQKLDPDLWIAGVILNQIAGSRHERVIRQAIESACGLPVLGAVPRAPEGVLLSTRHLGLVTPVEFNGRDTLASSLMDRVARHLDFDRLLAVARRSAPLGVPTVSVGDAGVEPRVTIGYLSDSAFSFYYPENLEALQAAGADLVELSALDSARIPDNLDALYIGGGFPETHAKTLAENSGLLTSLRGAARAGLPIYAECGGLMLLSRALTWQGQRHLMAGVLPFEVEVCNKPQGHGYTELLVDAVNPFFAPGTRLRGHEFHYSRVVLSGDMPATGCAVVRGSGCFTGRDAVIVGNVWASYTHLHALATPEWSRGMVQAARHARVTA